MASRKRKICSDFVDNVIFVILYALILYSLTCLILILSNDVEVNPGPTGISKICRLCSSDLEEEKQYLKLTFFIENYHSSLG